MKRGFQEHLVVFMTFVKTNVLFLLQPALKSEIQTQTSF